MNFFHFLVVSSQVIIPLTNEVKFKLEPSALEELIDDTFEWTQLQKNGRRSDYNIIKKLEKKMESKLHLFTEYYFHIYAISFSSHPDSTPQVQSIMTTKVDQILTTQLLSRLKELIYTIRSQVSTNNPHLIYNENVSCLFNNLLQMISDYDNFRSIQQRQLQLFKGIQLNEYQESNLLKQDFLKELNQLEMEICEERLRNPHLVPIIDEVFSLVSDFYHQIHLMKRKSNEKLIYIEDFISDSLDQLHRNAPITYEYTETIQYEDGIHFIHHFEHSIDSLSKMLHLHNQLRSEYHHLYCSVPNMLKSLKESSFYNSEANLMDVDMEAEKVLLSIIKDKFSMGHRSSLSSNRNQPSADLSRLRTLMRNFRPISRIMA